DLALRAVWLEFQRFFQTPGKRRMADLVATLLAPPFGLRAGLHPILAAAGLRAFGRAVAIRGDGVWVPDILASEIEEMCARPEAFEVEVFDVDGALGEYLREISEEFGSPAPDECDLLRHAQDALQAWLVQLPASALSSKHADQKVNQFRAAVSTGHDPVDVI
ncbi:MAG: hypothetical protein HQL38_08945, partial [Alphaproteobacteria bacterium]|nr:hypothetical protein [Alphaproteobacteria bacterium]